MDNFAIQCFLAIAETGSFTEAAKRVRRTQSAVTQQISKLESWLGKRLFQRGRTITLTLEGEMFFSYASQIDKLYHEVEDRFKEPELEGEISIGLPEDFATAFLTDILVGFQKIHPRILLSVECDLTLNLYERFKKKELDLVLVKMFRPEDFPTGVEIWSEPLDWVGVKANLKTYQQVPVPLALSPEPCVYRTQAIQALNAAKHPWKKVFVSPSYVGVTSAVAAGIGLTVLPRHMIPKELDSIQAPFLPPLPDLHVSLLKQSKTNVAIETLEEFLISKLTK